MSIGMASRERPVGVGAAGVRPGEQDGILAELPEGSRFQWLGFSDEGVDGPRIEYRPVPYYSDYNRMLEDPLIEVVLVDGPLEKRRDLAVRALNAGRHVVLRGPFCESALDAGRVMKTAARQGLLATVDLQWRDDVDLRALRRALKSEDTGAVHGAICLASVDIGPDVSGQAGPSAQVTAVPAVARWTEGGPSGAEMLERHGLAMLDQLRLLVNDDVKGVNAHILPAAPGALAEGFTIYLALRGGGWAIGQVSSPAAPDMPSWALYVSGAAFTARHGTATVTTSSGQRTYDADAPPEDFWQNLHAAIRQGAELKCSPVDVVRAMKLHEAALESAEFGEFVAV